MEGITASFTGRLTADATYQVLRDSRGLLSFTVAVDRTQGARQTVRCGYLGADAASLCSVLLEGAQVYAAGELTLRDGELRLLAVELDVKALIGHPPVARERTQGTQQQQRAAAQQRRVQEHGQRVADGVTAVGW